MAQAPACRAGGGVSQPATIYAVLSVNRIARRELIAEYVEPAEALHHCKLLRWAGKPATVALLTELDASELSDDQPK